VEVGAAGVQFKSAEVVIGPPEYESAGGVVASGAGYDGAAAFSEGEELVGG